MHRPITLAVLLALPAAAQDAAPFGTDADIAYAERVWEQMVERRLAGPDTITAFPYEGVEPHGFLLTTFYDEATVEGHTGTLIVKNNYGPEGVSIDEMIGDPSGSLASVTVMFRREPGYDPETKDWFWAKYLPDGTLDANPAGTALAGLVGKNAEAGCIACHVNGSEDLLFTTEATLD